MSPCCQAPHQPVTILPRHPISLSPYCPDILSACHPISQDTILPGHPISLAPISLSTYLTHTYLTLTLSHSHPISLTPYLISSSPDTISPCHPIARHPISLSSDYPRHPIAWTPYLTHTLSHSYPISHPILLRPYLTLTLFRSHPYLNLTLSNSHPISLSPISLSPYLTHTLSRSHPICVSPYRPCAQEVTEGMLELVRSRIETATELEQFHDQKDNLQEHLSMLKHTLVVVTLSHACTLRHVSLRLCFCLFLQICSTFK